MSKKKRPKERPVKPWMPAAAGASCIISGGVALAKGVETTLAIMAPLLPLGISGGGLRAALIGLGMMALVGGVFAMMRRRWPLALAGAVAACPLLAPLGVLAVIWVCLGRRGFTISELR